MFAKVNIYARNEANEVNRDMLDKRIIDRKEFKNLIIENIVIIARYNVKKIDINANKEIYFRALRHQLIIPDFRGFTLQIDTIFNDANQASGGIVADYIPQLAK